MDEMLISTILLFMLFAPMRAETTTAYEMNVKSCLIYQALFASDSSLLREIENSQGTGIRDAVSRGAIHSSKRAGLSRKMMSFPHRFAKIMLATRLETRSDLANYKRFVSRAKMSLAQFAKLLRHPERKEQLCVLGKAKDILRLDNVANKMARNSQVMLRSIVTAFRDDGNTTDKQKVRNARDFGVAVGFEALQVCFIDDNLDRFKTTCEVALQSKSDLVVEKQKQRIFTHPENRHWEEEGGLNGVPNGEPGQELGQDENYGDTDYTQQIPAARKTDVRVSRRKYKRTPRKRQKSLPRV